MSRCETAICHFQFHSHSDYAQGLLVSAPLYAALFAPAAHAPGARAALRPNVAEYIRVAFSTTSHVPELLELIVRWRQLHLHEQGQGLAAHRVLDAGALDRRLQDHPAVRNSAYGRRLSHVHGRFASAARGECGA